MSLQGDRFTDIARRRSRRGKLDEAISQFIRMNSWRLAALILQGRKTGAKTRERAGRQKKTAGKEQLFSLSPRRSCFLGALDALSWRGAGCPWFAAFETTHAI